MQPIKLREIVEATGAYIDRPLPDIEITEICTDSRDVRPGCIFVALMGLNFDGHKFVAQALEKGALYAIVQKEDDYGSDNILLVKSTRQAFLDIAGLYRSKFSPKVIAVTGSVGKTTTREMIASVIKSKYNTLKTENNLNNEVGVPKTILELNDSIEAMVLEFGMVNLGEIRELTVPAKPDIAVITCIGTCHIENLGSRENIKKAKFEILEGLKKGGTLLLNKDNDMLCNETSSDFNIVFYSIKDPSADIFADNITEYNSSTEFDILYKGNSYHTFIPCIGLHNVLNSLAGFGCGIFSGISPEQSSAALANFKPTGMRQKMVECRGVTVFEDCYNANPDSVKAAMETLKSRIIPAGAKKIAVLGDMLELGDVSVEKHIEAGKNAASACNILLCTGDMAQYICKGAKENGLHESFHFEDKESLVKFLKEIAETDDVIWIKASRGMKFEDIAMKFYEE